MQVLSNSYCWDRFPPVWTEISNLHADFFYSFILFCVNIECVTQAELTTMTNVLNTTHSNLLCPKQVEDLPVMWSIIGYVAVALAKIILSLIIIWVNKLYLSVRPVWIC